MGTVIKSERTRPFMPEIDILKLCIWERMNLFERRSTRRIPTGIEWGFQLAFDTYTGPRARRYLIIITAITRLSLHRALLLSILRYPVTAVL